MAGNLLEDTSLPALRRCHDFGCHDIELVSSPSDTRLKQDSRKLSYSKIMAHALQSYKYQSLPDSHSIRLATRKADIGSDIWACTFDTADINHPPEYVTLSYCWGDVNHLIPIRCDYGTVMVTQSASEMLKKLCYGPMPFWINSLCINQQDLMERNEQVTLMADIYSKASLVLVCLGPDLYKDTELLFNAFKHLVEEIRRVPAVGGTIQY